MWVSGNRRCLLSGCDRTWFSAIVMSTLCQKRTHALQQKGLFDHLVGGSQTADGGYSGGNTDRPALQWLLDKFLPTEANAPERPLRQTALSKETTHAHETRLIRVIPRQLGKSQFAQDCVVGLGVVAHQTTSITY